MKRFSIFLALASSFVLVAPVMAQSYGSAGCGLGSMIIEKEGFVQVFAATTNGTFGSQTFGITFGTSNCTDSGIVKKDKEQEAFVEANLPSLKRDMAAGGGEHIYALATLLGCAPTVHAELASFAQQNYDSVFPTPETTSMQALYGFKLQASMQDSFVNACARL